MRTKIEDSLWPDLGEEELALLEELLDGEAERLEDVGLGGGTTDPRLSKIWALQSKFGVELTIRKKE